MQRIEYRTFLERGVSVMMVNLPSCPQSDAGTFSTAVQTLYATNAVINLTQQSLVGTSISFTAPSTINIQPGSYIVNYALMGDSFVASQLVLVGLQLNGVIIANSTIGPSTFTSGFSYPEAIGSYLITTNTKATLQLICRAQTSYSNATVNAALTAVNAQTAQLTIFKL